MAKTKTLADVPWDLAFEAQQAALMRLQLYMIGRTHELLGALADRARDALVKAAGEDGKLDSVGFYLVQTEIEKAWAEMFGEWKRVFSGLRWEAGSLPFGTLAVLFERFIGVTKEEQRRSNEGARLEEQEGIVAVYEPQLKSILEAARARIYGDGFNLSQRIWRLDQASLAEIRRILAAGVAGGRSAWQMAEDLQGQLGAGSECPRWTSTRLYGRTKSDIASGDKTGLYSGDECRGQGVAYNALRLARNELQIVHARATDDVLRNSPWVEKERICLSPSHPAISCRCEEVVSGGENGDGVYPVGTVILPIHVQCLCRKEGVLMDEAEFVRRMRGWMNGVESWPKMDSFSDYLGVGIPGEIGTVNVAVGIANSLVTWLWGDESGLDAAVADGRPGIQLPLL